MRMTAEYEFHDVPAAAKFLKDVALMLYAWPLPGTRCQVWCARNEVLRVNAAAEACQGTQVAEWAEDEQKS